MKGVRQRQISLCALAVTAFAGLAAAAGAQEVMGTPENTTMTPLMPRTAVPDEPIVWQEGQRLSPIMRATTFVRDREASLNLYRDIFGLTQLMDNYWKGVGINRIKNTEGLEQRAAIFMAGLSNFGNIGVYKLYFEQLEIPPPSTRDRVVPGDAAIVLATRDIHRIYEAVKAAGLMIISPPVALGNHGAREPQLEMLFRDPDGILVNVIQPPGVSHETRE